MSTSSSTSNPNTSFVQFPAVFEAALEEYLKKTTIDLKTDSLFAKLQDCNSSDSVLNILQEQADAFEQFREGDGKVQLMKRLKPFVDVLLWLSDNDYLKTSLGSVRLARSFIFCRSSSTFIIYPADISTIEGNIYQCWSSTQSRCLSPLTPVSVVLTPES
jgi:hypothetical protein